jgi:hypothetical protein
MKHYGQGHKPGEPKALFATVPSISYKYFCQTKINVRHVSICSYIIVKLILIQKLRLSFSNFPNTMIMAQGYKPQEA